jgi:hypothetical protein
MVIIGQQPVRFFPRGSLNSTFRLSEYPPLLKPPPLRCRRRSARMTALPSTIDA